MSYRDVFLGIYGAEQPRGEEDPLRSVGGRPEMRSSGVRTMTRPSSIMRLSTVTKTTDSKTNSNSAIGKIE